MSEWDLIKLISAANSDSEVAELVVAHDFAGKFQAQEAVMYCFELTKENIAEHYAAARKIAAWEPYQWSTVACMRHAMLKEMAEHMQSEAPGGECA